MLSHKNIMKYCNRPFSSVKEMDETIIKNFNSKVKKGDTVYFLGDIGMGNANIINFFDKISRGIQFHLIVGNHDKKISRNLLIARCSSVNIMKDIKIQDQKITLCHYPMYTWNCSHYGAWQIHGHHHFNTQNIFYGKIMNVCVDNHNFSPVSFDEVKRYMNKKEDNWDLIKDEDKIKRN